MNLDRVRVLVTGGEGFLGKYVREALKSEGAISWSTSHKGCDLRKRKDIDDALNFLRPEVVIHLAASVGGIGANEANPGKYFYDNIVMGAEMMEASRAFGVKKYVQVGTSCSYPTEASVPVKESDLWKGPVNETTGPYGIAKLALITMAQAYRKQYAFNAISLIPVNLFGPRDTFDPDKSHVIPALILKCLQAKRDNKPAVVWGTGNATREFLYVAEAAKAIVMATEIYDKPDPVNLGSGKEILIKDLASIVAKAVGFTGEIIFDSTKPDGQLRRCFDVTKAREEFGFESNMSIEEGIQKTVEHYLNEQGLNICGKCETSKGVEGCDT